MESYTIGRTIQEIEKESRERAFSFYLAEKKKDIELEEKQFLIDYLSQNGFFFQNKKF